MEAHRKICGPKRPKYGTIHPFESLGRDVDEFLLALIREELLKSHGILKHGGKRFAFRGSDLVGFPSTPKSLIKFHHFT